MMRGGLEAVFRVLLVAIAVCLSSLTVAHPSNVASAQAKVQPDGTFSMRIRFDLTAFVTGAAPKDADDGAMNAFLDGTDDAMKATLAGAEARFRAEFVSGGSLDRLAFPTVADVRAFLAGDPKPRLPAMLTATAEGHLPPGKRTISFRYPATLGTIVQTVEFPYEEPISEPVEGGSASATLAIPTAEQVAKLAAAMNAPRTSTEPTVSPKTDPPKTSVSAAPRRFSIHFPRLEMGEPPAVPPPAKAPPAILSEPAEADLPAPTTQAPNASVFVYLRMGFTHILPEGLDHILFVLGLFLLGSNTKALLKQITAFTVAHSITLAMATLGIVRLPGRVIEPVIALSIAFVAIENLFVKDVRPWRTAVVFLFGLVHGMGFAEVFRDAGLSGRGLIAALLSFNVGVELGQLSVIAMALLAIGWFRKDERYRKVVVVPGSLLIALVALFWTVQRIVG